MYKYILKILRSQIGIVLCWGFCSPYILNNGLGFSVSGYLHKGKVEVVYDEGLDLFTIRLLDSKGDIIREIEGVYVDGVVDTIDTYVETGGNKKTYLERVRSQYGC